MIFNEVYTNFFQKLFTRVQLSDETFMGVLKKYELSSEETSKCFSVTATVILLQNPIKLTAFVSLMVNTFDDVELLLAAKLLKDTKLPAGLLLNNPPSPDDWPKRR